MDIQIFGCLEDLEEQPMILIPELGADADDARYTVFNRLFADMQLV